MREHLYLEVVKIQVETRQERVVEDSCGSCIFEAVSEAADKNVKRSEAVNAEIKEAEDRHAVEILQPVPGLEPL